MVFTCSTSPCAWGCLSLHVRHMTRRCVVLCGYHQTDSHTCILSTSMDATSEFRYILNKRCTRFAKHKVEDTGLIGARCDKYIRVISTAITSTKQLLLVLNTSHNQIQLTCVQDFLNKELHFRIWYVHCSHMQPRTWSLLNWRSQFQKRRERLRLLLWLSR